MGRSAPPGDYNPLGGNPAAQPGFKHGRSRRQQRRAAAAKQRRNRRRRAGGCGPQPGR